MSRSTTVCLNPTAPEFIPAAKPCERTPMTRAALPWLPIDQELPTSYEYGAEVTYLSFLHSQDHGYQMPLHDPASFGTHLISDPPLLEAMPQFFFENFLRHTRRQANILAKESAYATGDAMMAKLASASLGFLHSLGYEPAVVLRAITVREYSEEENRRSKKILQRAKAEVEAEARCSRKARR